MPTTIKEAIKQWEQREGKKPEEATEVKLIGMRPPIERMDENLNVFEACTKLSLSSNNIERVIALPKLRNLQILSLGRNNIKRIIGLDDFGATLEELWISYNQIEKLDGLGQCNKLRVLFISNNRINNWGEVQKLSQLPAISSVLLKGNPIYTSLQAEKKEEELHAMVLKRVPQLEQIDCKTVGQAVRAAAERLE